MKLKMLFSGLICSVLAVFMLMQTHIVLAVVSDPNNPITAAITAAINIVNPSPSASAQPNPTSTPNTSNPVSLPIINPSHSPSPIPSPSATPSPTSMPDPVVVPVITKLFPNPATSGTFISLTGSGFNGTSKVFVDDILMPTNYNLVSKNGKKLTFLLSPKVGFKANETYEVYVLNSVKSNKVDLIIAPTVTFYKNTPLLNSKQLLIAPSVRLEDTRPELVLASSNFNTFVTIPSTVTNPILDFSNLLSVPSEYSEYVAAVYNNKLEIDSFTSAGNINIKIEAFTMIKGPKDWDGKMNGPKLLNNEIASPSAEAGKIATVSKVIEVGADDTSLTFDKPVRILIAGQAGKLVGFQKGSVFTKITASCRADDKSAIFPNFADCNISVGNDLVIWTNHFTKFITYTQTSSPSTSSNSNTTASSSSNNPGNAGAPVCTDTKPQSAPRLLSVKVSGRNQVTLTWSKAADPVTYYLIAYGTKSGQMEYGNPNIGGKDTTSYVIKGLNNNQTYYFKVRAGNNCMPGEFSNELSAQVSGDNLSNPAKGFKPGILSAQTQESSSEADLKFKPITQAYPQRIVFDAKNALIKVVSFFANLFGRG